jgi:hypothetical protein
MLNDMYILHFVSNYMQDIIYDNIEFSAMKNIIF